MNIQESRALINYMYWSRDRSLDAVDAITIEQFVRNLGNSFSSIRDTLVHTLWAEMIWLSRWCGEPTAPQVSVETFPDSASLRKAWLAHESRMRSYFETIDEQGLQRSIAYKGLNGQPYETPLCQMLQHVANHGTYHRGQITTMLRQLGAAPPKGIDLITFYRETV